MLVQLAPDEQCFSSTHTNCHALASPQTVPPRDNEGNPGAVGRPQRPATPPPVFVLPRRLAFLFILRSVYIRPTIETMELLSTPFVFVDIETTGGSPVSSRVLEVAVIKVHQGKIVDEYESLLNPDEYIPPFISQLTGITDGDVASAPFFNQIAAELYDFMAGSVFVAHNVNFDLSFLQTEFHRFGIDFEPARFCTVQLSRALYPEYTTHKLAALIERHDIRVDDRHRAYADARAIVDFYDLAGRECGQDVRAAAVARQLNRFVGV